MKRSRLLMGCMARESPAQAEDQREECYETRGMLDRASLSLLRHRASRARPMIFSCSNRSRYRLDRLFHPLLLDDRLSAGQTSAEDDCHAGQEPEDRRSWGLSHRSHPHAPKCRPDHEEGCSQRTFHVGGDGAPRLGLARAHALRRRCGCAQDLDINEQLVRHRVGMGVLPSRLPAGPFFNAA